MLFKEVKLEGKSLDSSMLSYKDSWDNYRLYHTEISGGGFYFVLLKFKSCPYTEVKDLWNTDTECSFVLDGSALYDGIRHLNFAEEGYMNYPDLEILSSVFKVLKGLEGQLCTYIDDCFDEGII